MEPVTKLKILLSIDDTQNINDAIGKLPGYCSETFSEHKKGYWSGEFIVSCSVAPELAEGDFVDDLSPYFPEFLRMKTFYDAGFELQIAVGTPAPASFELASHSVAMLAALGATITVVGATPDGEKLRRSITYVPERRRA